MKNDKKKIGFSPTKKIFSAAAMLAVSASMLATSTYAWFSMNTQVTATGMNVKAKAEGGIVIANVSQSNWTNEADANYSDVIALYPTSTADTIHWYHAKSTDLDNAAAYQTAQGAYTELTGIALSDATNSEGVGYIETASGGSATFSATDDECYYLLSKYFIKSSGTDLPAETNLYINNVSVSSIVNNVAQSFNAVDLSLRVAIKVGSGQSAQTFIYTPITTLTVNSGGGQQTLVPDFSYHVNAAENLFKTYNPTTATSGGSSSGAYNGGKNVVTRTGAITSTAIPVEIYVYFEGEDSNCKSSNVNGITLNNLEVSVQFGTTEIA